MQHTSDTAPDSPARPFEGMVVVELGHSVAAPFAGQIFGELGATVIKVEKQDGDAARAWGPPFQEGAATLFQALNRNKQSVVCDLRDAAQTEALRQLIAERADVVLQNLRPGQVDALGLGGAALLALKPSLVYCNMGAFGGVGPLRQHPGYDPLMQAFGGIMSTTGEAGRPSVRVGASIVDMGTGMWAVIGVLAALLQRQASGRGRIVDVSLFETATTWVSLIAAQVLVSGEAPPRYGSGTASIVPYKGYATADGEIVVAAGNDGLFRSLAKVVGHPEWAQDPRYADNPSRVANQAELYGALDAIFARQPTAYWLERLEAAGLPCSPVNDMNQMLAHPQTQALGLVQRVPGTGMDFIGLPLSFDGQRPRPRSRPPMLGEHTATLLGQTPATLETRT
ncbi:CaiB/BaiF CoA transferase family protein [Bordetella hinzii]|nr:CoA transferase [Bordetella hinzii]AKQ54109.1 Formyl-coenzyme A transferase [Bordetella hinzii]AKQ58623.1 Formyl-coenzyme A transferase [Bordetella hinzii]KCB26849.1 CoA-transferase family III protein [Bordetella hinzii L60]KCB29666.1 CoA-transferase family III protein [Bordetella hinzii CA90 BAL1384]KCB49168.1 CoA-transferase family III protein [Bordetella hinzii 4161]